MYVLCALAIVNSATNGYDGSMMNGLQTLSYWNNCMFLFFYDWHMDWVHVLNIIIYFRFR
jgi:hypothetical protein